MSKTPPHKLTITPQGNRLRATCACGQWVRTTTNDAEARARLSARFVDHVTGANRLA